MPKRVYTQTFAVVGAIIERDGKILLVKEGLTETGEDGQWNHPAGWLEVGQPPIEAIKAEVLEESGYQFEPRAILGIYSLVKKDVALTVGTPVHPLKLIFTGYLSVDPPQPLKNETTDIGWFSVEEVESMDNKTLRDGDIKLMVADYFAGKRYPLDLVHHNIVEN
jgi:ADP-ribose pyrophosphatase YjhB (NUDIX family)